MWNEETWKLNLLWAAYDMSMSFITKSVEGISLGAFSTLMAIWKTVSFPFSGSLVPFRQIQIVYGFRNQQSQIWMHIIYFIFIIQWITTNRDATISFKCVLFFELNVNFFLILLSLNLSELLPPNNFSQRVAFTRDE